MGGEGKTKTTPSRCERARDEYVMASLCDAHAGGSKSDDPHTHANISEQTVETKWPREAFGRG